MQIRSNLQIVNNHCTLNVLLYLQCSVEQINQDVNDLANPHKKDEIKKRNHDGLHYVYEDEMSICSQQIQYN